MPFKNYSISVVSASASLLNIVLTLIGSVPAKRLNNLLAFFSYEYPFLCRLLNPNLHGGEIKRIYQVPDTMSEFANSIRINHQKKSNNKENILCLEH
jgi:hypothetical protein